ncbi:hypothetical protein SAV31267_054730 [Streptomyces avermitilis]|uniref:Uncharacterized protein n=1 Tax=Streptomyces avermitilis TaxID=33903 RepID=A0A4D4MV06_STRAX|nr:hypothetical protein SAV31267_054730 [Streptomyces avermitilis]
MLAGQAAHDGEAEPGAGEAAEVGALAGHGAFGAAQLHVAHDQAAVLDGDDDTGRHFLDVHVDLGGRRREVRGVVEEFGECVHHALGGVSGDGGLAGGVDAHALVAADAAHRAAQDRLHDDGACPAAARAGAGEHGHGVGEAARLRGAVVEVQQVGEDLLVGVPLLHAAQVGEHPGGEGLHTARHVAGHGDGGRTGAGGVTGALGEAGVLLGEPGDVGGESRDVGGEPVAFAGEVGGELVAFPGEVGGETVAFPGVVRGEFVAFAVELLGTAGAFLVELAGEPGPLLCELVGEADAFAGEVLGQPCAFLDEPVRQPAPLLAEVLGQPGPFLQQPPRVPRHGVQPSARQLRRPHAVGGEGDRRAQQQHGRAAAPGEGARTESGAAKTAPATAIPAATAVTSGKGAMEPRVGRSPGGRGAVMNRVLGRVLGESRHLVLNLPSLYVSW